jgi:NTE family protein
MDQLHADLEHIKLFNQSPGVRRIDTLVITPSQDLSEIARRHRNELPRSLRALLRTLGANNSAGTELLSYLLFERGYTRELIALGQSDARARAAEIRKFLALEHAPRFRAPSSSESA